MIDTFLSIVKPIDAPGSIQFFFLCLAVGLVLIFVWPRKPRLGRNWLIGVVIAYLVLALPVVANGIARTLPAAELAPPPDLGALDTLVILDGDNRRGRLSSAALVYTRSHPRVVWVLGGEPDWLRDELVAAGVSAAAIRVDPGTRNTREQMEWILRHRRMEHTSRVAIVASRLQMPRISGLARAAALSLPLVSSPIDEEPPAQGVALLVPTYVALRVSRDALYEHAALMYYRNEGWIGR